MMLIMARNPPGIVVLNIIVQYSTHCNIFENYKLPGARVYALSHTHDFAPDLGFPIGFETH